MDGDSWLSWIPIVFLLCMAAYFAVAETAATSVSRIRLKTRLDQGDQKAKRALYVQDNFDRAISAIPIGTNTVHISTATLTTVLVTRTWGASWWRLARSCARSRCFLPERCSPRASPSATVNGAPLRRRRPCAFLCAFRAAGEGTFAHRRILLESRQGRAGDHRDRG